ncbi:MAG: alpha/beta hydrolase, partial [Mycobacteriales bacterium]
AAFGLRVQCNGVVDPPPAEPSTCVSRAAADRQQAAEVAQALARAALLAADEVDGDAARALLRGTESIAGVGGAGVSPQTVRPDTATAHIWTPASIPTRGSAREVAAWWAALPGEAQEALVGLQPDALGGLNGVPASVRHAANVEVLERASAEAQETMARASTAFGGPDLPAYLSALSRQSLVASVRSELAGDPQRRLLTLNFGDGGHAAVAVGDVDTARHVAILVPGLNADARGDLDNLVGDAMTVQTTAKTVAPNESVAVVAWIGYRTPNLISVLLSKRAQAGGKRLAAFTRGVDEARAMARVGRGSPDPFHLTVVGHSYGSHATAEALERTDVVDDAVFLGSPGVDQLHSRQLIKGGGHLYVAEAGDDGYADLGGWFRQDPSWRGFGAIPLPTGGAMIDDRWWEASHGHSEYYTPGTESVRRIAGVVLGTPVG